MAQILLELIAVIVTVFVTVIKPFWKLLLGLLLLCLIFSWLGITFWVIVAGVGLFAITPWLVKHNPFTRPKIYTAEELQHFNQLVFRLTGYIARGGGRITNEQVALVRQYVAHLNLVSEVKQEYIKEFNLGKQPDFDPTTTCQELLKYIRFHNAAKNRCLEFLITIIYADGKLSTEELQRITTVANLLHISNSTRQRLLNQAQAIYEFDKTCSDGKASDYSSFHENTYSQHSSSQNTNYQQANGYQQYYRSYSSYNSYNYQNQNQNQSQHEQQPAQESLPTTVEAALKVFNLPKDATFAQVRKAFLKMQMKYHPDRLGSLGLSKEVQAKYEEKAKICSVAYTLLEKYYQKQ